MGVLEKMQRLQKIWLASRFIVMLMANLKREVAVPPYPPNANPSAAENQNQQRMQQQRILPKFSSNQPLGLARLVSPRMVIQVVRQLTTAIVSQRKYMAQRHHHLVKILISVLATHVEPTAFAQTVALETSLLDTLARATPDTRLQ